MRPYRVDTAYRAAASDDPDPMLCEVETVANSRILRRVCMSGAERESRQARWLSFERFWMAGPNGNPGGFD
jgi:hypothetical protein